MVAADRIKNGRKMESPNHKLEYTPSDPALTNPPQLGPTHTHSQGPGRQDEKCTPNPCLVPKSLRKKETASEGDKSCHGVGRKTDLEVRPVLSECREERDGWGYLMETEVDALERKLW